MDLGTEAIQIQSWGELAAAQNVQQYKPLNIPCQMSAFADNASMSSFDDKESTFPRYLTRYRRLMGARDVPYGLGKQAMPLIFLYNL